MNAATAKPEQALLNELRRLGIDAAQVCVRGEDLEIRGHANSYDAKRRATKAAEHLLPLFRVLNQVRVVPGAAHSDGQILTAVRDILRALATDGPPQVDVTVRSGIVELSGRLPSMEAVCRLSNAVWGVAGVRDVVSRIEVTAPQPALAAQLSESVARVLGLPPGSVRVRLEGCTAIVEGAVRTEGQRWVAEDLLRWHARVYDVVNRLKVVGDVAPREPPKMTA